jgi:hypothetical protein
LLSNRFAAGARAGNADGGNDLLSEHVRYGAAGAACLPDRPELGVNLALILAYYQSYRPMLAMRPPVAPPALFGGKAGFRRRATGRDDGSAALKISARQSAVVADEYLYHTLMY